MARTPFLTRSEADDVFERQIWARLRDGTIDVISDWVKGIKRDRYKEERQEFDRIKPFIEEAGLPTPITFESLWASGKASGLIDSYIAEQVRRQCSKEATAGELATIYALLPNLPAIRCFLLHQLAYFFAVNIRQKRPQSHGNNIDARHIIAASNADVFITDDMGIFELLKAAEGHWPFTATTTEAFCSRAGDSRL